MYSGWKETIVCILILIVIVIGSGMYYFDKSSCAVFHNNNYSENNQELWINSQYYKTYHDDVAHFKGEAWQFHIQQMAVVDDPLLYMFNYIKNEN